jgi:hypothetical protein
MNISVPGAEEASARALAEILSYTPDEADCALCLNQLEDYVQTQLRGAAYQPQFAWTARHLDSCVACAAAYALLYEVGLAEANGRLPHPAHTPAPDLSFLQSQPGWLATLRAALTAAPERLSLQLNEALARLLAPAPAPALTRAVGDGRYTPKLLELTPDQAQEAALPFTLTAYADRQQPDRCLVEITVQPPGQSWPDLGGYQVTLAAGEQIFTGKTDDWGTAVFFGIPLAKLNDLKIEVMFSNSPD